MSENEFNALVSDTILPGVLNASGEVGLLQEKLYMKNDSCAL